MLYNVVLVSTVQQSESVIRIHISPLFWISFPFRSVTTGQWVEFPELYHRFSLVISLVIYFIHSISSVYTSIPISQFIPPPFPPWYLCLYFCFVNKIVYTNFFRFHIYALIYNICFSLSHLLHSVWQSLGPSMSLQMTQFGSFLWLSNIPLYICTTSSLTSSLLMDI